MKRFYQQAAAAPAAGGFAILLDGRPVKTPAKMPLEVPAGALAEAIAAEWNAQGETIEPRAMPLTGLANAAIDRVAPDPAGFARGLALYGETDLLCYRAEAPEALVRRQGAAWDPVLAWARRRFDVDFVIVSGVMPRSQPEATIGRLAKALAALGPFHLAGLSPLVTIGGSLPLALALAEGAVDLDTAWAAATLDEAWQAEHWGQDPLALAAFDERRRQFEAGCRFLQLL